MHDENNKPDQLDASASGILSSHRGAFFTTRLKRPRCLTYLSLALVLGCFFGLIVVSPPTVDAWNWDAAMDGAAIGAGAGFVVGTAATPGVGTAIGTIAGLVGGFVVGGLLGGQAEGADVSQAKQDYASYLIQDMINWLGYCDANAHNMGQFYNTSYFQWVRWAEWEAKNVYNQEKAANQSHVWNAEKILSGSGVVNATQQFIWAAVEMYNAAFASWEDLSDRFTGTYTGMTWGTKQTAYQYYQVDQLSYGLVRFGYDIKTLGTGYLPTDQDLIVFGNGTLTLKYANGTTAAMYALDPTGVTSLNVYKTSGLRSGAYSFTGGDKVIGYSSKMAASTGTATPIVYTLHKDAVSGNATLVSWATSAGQQAECGFVTTTPLSYSLFVGYDSITGLAGFENVPSYSIELRSYLSALADLQTQVDDATATVSNYAQTFYNLLVATNGDQAAPMPDFMFPDVQYLIDQGYTLEQIQAMFFAYLKTQQTWYETHSDLTPEDVNISLESLHIKCRGEIYLANGTQVGLDDSIFTPYISTKELDLHLGNNTWNQAGFVIIWGDGSNPSSLRNNSCLYSECGVGDYMIIDAIWLDNAPVSSVKLGPTTIHTVVYEPDTHNGTQIKTWTDLGWIAAHWYYLAIIGGVIMLVAGMATRNPSIMLVGLAAVAVGGAVWYMSGDKSVLGGLLDIEHRWMSDIIERWK